MTNEEQIRILIEEWADATREGKKDEVLTNHAPDALIFDPMPPFSYESAAEYRKSFDEWWPDTKSENGLFELLNLKVFAGDDVAFAHSSLHCGGTLPDGTTFQDTVRLTLCLQKQDGRWRFVHTHTSVPALHDK